MVSGSSLLCLGANSLHLGVSFARFGLRLHDGFQVQRLAGRTLGSDGAGLSLSAGVSSGSLFAFRSGGALGALGTNGSRLALLARNASLALRADGTDGAFGSSSSWVS